MDAACFQPHQCLGDARQYQQLAEQQRQLELEQQRQLHQQEQQDGQQVEGPPASMACIDPSTVNPDVWAAASLLGDKGLQLINIYRELEECRWVELPTHQVSPHLLGPTEGNVIAALPETLVLPDWAVVSSKL